MSTVHRNAVVGETVTVHGVTDGVLRLEIDVEPAHHAPALHVHPRAAETFTVLEGELRVRTGLRRRTLRAGDSVTVPPGTVHAYAGVPGRSARVLVELDPPGRMAEFFAAVHGVPAAGRSPRTGHPTRRSRARTHEPSSTSPSSRTWPSTQWAKSAPPSPSTNAVCP